MMILLFKGYYNKSHSIYIGYTEVHKKSQTCLKSHDTKNNENFITFSSLKLTSNS